MKLILPFLFNVFTGINQQAAFAVDSARSSSSSPINHAVNSADSSFKSFGDVAMGTEDPAANFATKHKKDKKTSAVIPSMNSQAPLTSLHLLDLHREFRGSKLTATAPAPGDAEQERLLKKKNSQDSPRKRTRERQEGKGGKNGQSQSQAAAEEAEESNRALEICEKDRVELRWERDMLQKELETCEKKVDELQDKLAAPEYLFAQQADQCLFGIDAEGNFYLESSKFLDQTEQFTDRPLRMESAIPTSEWFPEGFNQRFAPENSEDGWPNSAIALVDDDVSQGIYVSAFVSAYAREDGTFGYLLKQSDSQAAVKPLEDLLPSGLSETTIDHCSLFIDSVGADCTYDSDCASDEKCMPKDYYLIGPGAVKTCQLSKSCSINEDCKTISTTIDRYFCSDTYTRLDGSTATGTKYCWQNGPSNWFYHYDQMNFNCCHLDLRDYDGNHLTWTGVTNLLMWPDGFQRTKHCFDLRNGNFCWAFSYGSNSSPCTPIASDDGKAYSTDLSKCTNSINEVVSCATIAGSAQYVQIPYQPNNNVWSCDGQKLSV